MKTKSKKLTAANKSAIAPNSNSLINGMRQAGNVSYTFNGAKTNATSLSACVDYFAKGAAMRAQTEANVISLFEKAFYEDRLTAMKTLFYTRDVREGQGERNSFRVVIRWLADNYTDVLEKNLTNIALFGRWDDLYSLVGTKAEKIAFELIAKQLKEDANNANENKPISLLAKWLKSINTSSAESRRLGYQTAKALGLNAETYRKLLSALRKHINVLECKMSAGQWTEIDYEKVPSKASLQYRKAFCKRDFARYKEFLGAVEKGEAKINASVLYPYEIIRPIETNMVNSTTEMQVLDAQWKAQPDWMAENPHRGIAIVDTSGSMHGLPILVSVSLGIYFAERNVGPFKDHFITFSTTPILQRIVGNTIYEKVKNLNRSGWSMSTNVQSAFDLILNTAIKNSVPVADMPDTLYIISDMQYDVATGCNHKTNFEVIKQKYNASGYKIPRLVFWNVNASNTDSPVTINDSGVCLVSGCNPSILKSVLGAKITTPVDVMFETLNKDRYDVIKI